MQYNNSEERSRSKSNSARAGHIRISSMTTPVITSRQQLDAMYLTTSQAQSRGSTNSAQQRKRDLPKSAHEYSEQRKQNPSSQPHQEFYNTSQRIPKPSAPLSDSYHDVEKMKRKIKRLEDDLSAANGKIRKLKEKEQEVNERIAKQVQNQVQISGKFENLSQNSLRPSHIIEKFGLLYTQDRLDAMDELDQIIGLAKYGKHQEMKQKILYGIMIASYKVSCDYLEQLKSNIYRLLNIPKNHSADEKDEFGEALSFLSKYFQATTQLFDLKPIIMDVQDQLVQLLPEFPSLSQLNGIESYIEQCCYISWAMINQFPPMQLEHSQDRFSPSYHTRFHASSDKNAKIRMYIWPALIDSATYDVLHKGVVWT